VGVARIESVSAVPTDRTEQRVTDGDHGSHHDARGKVADESCSKPCYNERGPVLAGDHERARVLAAAQVLRWAM